MALVGARPDDLLPARRDRRRGHPAHAEPGPSLPGTAAARGAASPRAAASCSAPTTTGATCSGVRSRGRASRLAHRRSAVTLLVDRVGLVLGSIAGYFGRQARPAISGLIDLTWGFPLILVAVIFVGMVGQGLTGRRDRGRGGHLGRLRADRAGPGDVAARSASSSRRRARSACRSGRSCSATWSRTCMGTVLVMASYYIAITVIAEAGFSFIGLGRAAADAEPRRR